MLEPLLESEKKEKILLYIHAHGEAYPMEIARAFGIYINAVQNQLQKLEHGGVLYSRLKGNVRLFGFNPRYPFRKQLVSLLVKVLQFISEEEKERYYMPRLRPRRSGKPY